VTAVADKDVGIGTELLLFGAILVLLAFQYLMRALLRSEDRADQQRRVDGIARGGDDGLRIGVAQRVDVRGVLRPHRQVWSGLGPRLHRHGHALGRPRVVVQDGPTLGVEVQPGSGHVALDRQDARGRTIGRSWDEYREQHDGEGTDEGGRA